MSRTRHVLAYSLLVISLADSTAAWGQGTRPDPYAVRIGLGAESYTWQRATGTQAASRRAATYGAAQAGAQRAAAKPFNTVVHEPTVSPYMNLYRDDREDGAPNYHLYVLPQQQQLDMNRHRAMQIQTLERQLQQATYTTPAGPAPTGAAGPARYGDTGRYYQGWRR